MAWLEIAIVFMISVGVFLASSGISVLGFTAHGPLLLVTGVTIYYVIATTWVIWNSYKLLPGRTGFIRFFPVAYIFIALIPYAIIAGFSFWGFLWLSGGFAAGLVIAPNSKRLNMRFVRLRIPKDRLSAELIVMTGLVAFLVTGNPFLLAGFGLSLVLIFYSKLVYRFEYFLSYCAEAIKHTRQLYREWRAPKADYWNP